MFVGIDISLTGSLTAFASPVALFANGEVGAWYDPSDLTTLFQDNLGATPVTAPGQTVGLLLDKSQNGVGTNGSSRRNLLVATATLSTQSVTVTAVAHTLSFTGTGTVTLTGASIAGPLIGTGASNRVSLTFTPTAASLTLTVVGSVTLAQLEIGSTATAYQPITTSWSATLAGNHATQATLAQRPTYGINPITGTRNVLTYSQDFSQSIWAVAGAATKTASASVCPDGTTSAYTISVGTGSNFFWYNSLNITAAARYEPSVYIKRVTTTGTLRINSANGTANGQWTINLALLGSGFERITRSHPAVTVVTEFTGTGNNFSGITFVSVAGTLQFEVWGAQIELGTTSTAYQKVVTQYEVTQAGIQSIGYLLFDGVDDGMVTGTITPAIDKVQIFVGLRKLSDAAQKIVAELSATIASNAGSFALTAPNSAAANYNFSSKGTTQTDNVVTTYTAPITNVISGLGDIAGASNLIRVNSAQVGSTLTTQGTGNYLAYPLYIGRRGGTTLPFNGRLYSMIVRFGANLTTGQITSTESWVNGKTGAY